MSPGKLAAQAAHAALGQSSISAKDNVVVLGLSDKKYYQTLNILIQDGTNVYIVVDKGYTEVPKDTETCFSYVEGSK
jgi:peptidyl-tRNA hydrolase